MRGAKSSSWPHLAIASKTFCIVHVSVEQTIKSKHVQLSRRCERRGQSLQCLTPPRPAVDPVRMPGPSRPVLSLQETGACGGNQAGNDRKVGPTRRCKGGRQGCGS